jgi:hypothetical protein
VTFSFSFGLSDVFDPSENLPWDEKEALLAIRDREVEDFLSQTSSATIAARGYRNGALSIGAAVSTTILAVDTITYDTTAGGLDATTGRFRVPAAGYYQVNGNCCFNLNNNPEEVEFNIYVNASIASSGGRLVVRGGTAGDDFGLTVNDVVYVTRGQYVDLRVDHIQGGNVAALNTGVQHNYFSIHKL